jgi:hypothetical protein
MIAPRRGVSCRRGAGQGGDCEPDCGAAPVSRGRTSRRHGDLDATDADAHKRADLEQLEPDGAAGGLGEVGIVEPDTAQSIEQLQQGAIGVGSHVVSQRDSQSGAARPPHRCVLADAWRARRDPPNEPAREVRVRDHSRASDQDRGARDRACRAYPRAAANHLPGRGAFRYLARGLMPSGP